MDTRILTEAEISAALLGMTPRPKPGPALTPLLLSALVIETVAIAAVIAWWLL